jgi:uncharacterized membrane protein
MDINTFITNHEITIRLSFFFGVFIIMAIWEMAAPGRQLIVPKLLRWSNNLAA